MSVRIANLLIKVKPQIQYFLRFFLQEKKTHQGGPVTTVLPAYLALGRRLSSLLPGFKTIQILFNPGIVNA